MKMTNRPVSCASIDSKPRRLLSNQLFLWPWIFFNAILAALGGGPLAFGPFELDPPLVLLFGIGFGFVGGGLWIWALRSPAGRARWL